MEWFTIGKRKKIKSINKFKRIWKIYEPFQKMITITKRAVILACSGKKETVCVCLLVRMNE